MSLTKSKKIPVGEKQPPAGDCYYFALSNPHVDVVITCPFNTQPLKENLSEVAKGPMTAEELSGFGKAAFINIAFSTLR